MRDQLISALVIVREFVSNIDDTTSIIYIINTIDIIVTIALFRFALIISRGYTSSPSGEQLSPQNKKTVKSRP